MIFNCIVIIEFKFNWTGYDLTMLHSATSCPNLLLPHAYTSPFFIRINEYLTPHKYNAYPGIYVGVLIEVYLMRFVILVKFARFSSQTDHSPFCPQLNIMPSVLVASTNDSPLMNLVIFFVV